MKSKLFTFSLIGASLLTSSAFAQSTPPRLSFRLDDPTIGLRLDPAVDPTSTAGLDAQNELTPASGSLLADPELSTRLSESVARVGISRYLDRYSDGYLDDRRAAARLVIADPNDPEVIHACELVHNEFTGSLSQLLSRQYQMRSTHASTNAMILEFFAKFNADQSPAATRARTLLENHRRSFRGGARLSPAEATELKDGMTALAEQYGMLVPASDIVCPTAHPHLAAERLSELKAGRMDVGICGETPDTKVEDLVPAEKITRLYFGYDVHTGFGTVNLDVEAGRRSRLYVSAVATQPNILPSLRFQDADIVLGATKVAGISYASVLNFRVQRLTAVEQIFPLGLQVNNSPYNSYVQGYMPLECQILSLEPM